MLVVLKQLLSPLTYLRISHSSKRFFDWLLPGFFAILMFLGYRFSAVTIPITGVDGIISAVTEFVKFSAGFYITALAAVATFNRPDMDELMATAVSGFQTEYHSHVHR